MTVRNTAVAGMFYPDDADELHDLISGYLSASLQQPQSDRLPKALVLPHAGYIYSGQVAADGYALLQQGKKSIRRVVLLGPAHRVALRGIAVPTHDNFMSPLGQIPLDLAMIRQLLAAGLVTARDDAHLEEHSLEVHLPFLQETLDKYTLIPMVVGAVKPDQIAKVLEIVSGGKETLIVVSSDLSHFLPYDRASYIDQRTSEKIVDLDAHLQGEEACGCYPLNGLLKFARKHQMTCELLSLKNSGDTAGDKSRVVGYGAFALYDS